MSVIPGTWWRRVAPGFGRGAKHLVLSQTGPDIITWSQPFGNCEIGGQTWRGPLADFLKEFHPSEKP